MDKEQNNTNPENVGLDPTSLGQLEQTQQSIPPVETLDAAPVVEQPVGATPPRAPKEKKGFGKVIFALVVILLIAGVAFGVYYYLNLAKNNDVLVNFKKVVSTVGEPLPTDVKEYADFVGINPETCVLDNSKVDIENPGSYDYTITCNKKVYNGKIDISEPTDFHVRTKTVYRTIGEEVTPEDFIEECSNTECTYEFQNPEAVKEHLTKIGGPNDVVIIATSAGVKVEVGASLVVTDEPIVTFLACTSAESAVEGYNAVKSVTDTFAIKNGAIHAGITVREYKYRFANQDEFDKGLESYTETKGFDGLFGKFVFDNIKTTFTIQTNLTQDVLNIEYGDDLPDKLLDIKEYYETDKKYTCEHQTNNQGEKPTFPATTVTE